MVFDTGRRSPPVSATLRRVAAGGDGLANGPIEDLAAPAAAKSPIADWCRAIVLEKPATVEGRDGRLQSISYACAAWPGQPPCALLVGLEQLQGSILWQATFLAHFGR